MKNFTLLGTRYLYILFSIIIITAATFSFSGSTIYAAAGDPPTITITSPTENQITNNTTVKISGTFTNTDPNVPFANLVFTALDRPTETDQDKAISNSTDNPGDWVLSEADSTWSFSKKLLPGIHILTFQISESNDTSKAGTSSKITFTIDTSRPTVTSTTIVIPGSPGPKTGEDFTNVPANAKLRFTVADNYPMTQLKNSIDGQTYNPVKVLLEPTTANGTETDATGSVAIVDNGLQNGKYVYDITFTPDSSLELNKAFLIYLKTDLADDAKNGAYAKFFKFTTTSNTDWNNPNKQDNPDNPHGHFSLKTDMCANCHSSHVLNHLQTSNPTSDREGGSYLLTYNEQLHNTSQSYCMACHDGTLNKAPIVNNIYNQYHHNNPADTTTGAANNLKEAVSCTSCHNPHLQYSDSNPNLLTDHFVYTHHSNDAGKGGLSADTLQIDSLSRPCDSCHGSNEINSEATSSTAAGDGYKALNYKKSTNATGIADDYSICLRCHNGKNGVSDINQYYTGDQTGSKHHITAADGSLLNGQLPCAECHETHGSTNIIMLRKQLGNVQITDSSKLFTSSGTTWNTENERNFCLTCHNNGTELYGQAAKVFDTTITEHQDASKACSNCHYDPTKNHRTFTQRSRSAAHSPHAAQTPQEN